MRKFGSHFARVVIVTIFGRHAFHSLQEHHNILLCQFTFAIDEINSMIHGIWHGRTRIPREALIFVCSELELVSKLRCFKWMITRLLQVDRRHIRVIHSKNSRSSVNRTRDCGYYINLIRSEKTGHRSFQKTLVVQCADSTRIVFIVWHSECWSEIYSPDHERHPASPVLLLKNQGLSLSDILDYAEINCWLGHDTICHCSVLRVWN